MDEKIKNHVTKYCESKGYGTTDNDIIEAIREGKEVWSGNEDEHRHWIEFDKVVEINGMFIQFLDAKGAGDIGVYDAGWEFEEDTIIEVQPKEVKTIIYEPVQ